MDPHSIATQRLMEQVKRGPRPSATSQSTSSNTTSTSFSSPSAASTSSLTASLLAHGSPFPALIPPSHSPSSSSHAASSATSLQGGTAVRDPVLLAQQRRRAAAERAAIQQKLKNQWLKTQNQLKKQKELEEKIRTWEDILLPHFDEYRGTQKLKDHCYKGIPTNIRGKVWPKLIGNALQVLLPFLPYLSLFISIPPTH